MFRHSELENRIFLTHSLANTDLTKETISPALKGQPVGGKGDSPSPRNYYILKGTSFYENKPL